MITVCIELNWLCKHMKKVRSSLTAILVLNRVKHSFPMWVSLVFSMKQIIFFEGKSPTFATFARSPILNVWQSSECASALRVLTVETNHQSKQDVSKYLRCFLGKSIFCTPFDCYLSMCCSRDISIWNTEVIFFDKFPNFIRYLCD